ncbi:MAG: 3D domain-containing protein [Vicinamibacterales bacterium]
MRRTISRSTWKRVAATLIAVSAFVLAYEATTIDSVWPWAANPVDPTRPQPGARLQFQATAYCKGQTTASGVGVRTGIAAADRTLLPVGSVIAVTTDNTRYNGVYTVMDTGPAVQGRIIDLYMWSCKEALAFGRKDIQVEVLRLGWNPNASRPALIDRIFRRPARRPAPVPAQVPPATEPVPGEENTATTEEEPVLPAAPVPEDAIAPPEPAAAAAATATAATEP